MQNTQQSNAPIECRCSKGCIATLHVKITTTHKDDTVISVVEADVCGKGADIISRAMMIVPGLHWSAEKITPRAIPMPQTTPDDKTRPVTLALDHASELTSPMNTNTDIPVEAIDEETSGVIDMGYSTPLPLQDDPTTNAVPDRPLPSLAHRVYVLKRLVEAFDDALGFRSGDVSMDRKVSFDDDLVKHGAKHKTMQVPLGASTFAGRILNATVYIDKGRVVFHVFRFEDFVPWMRLLIEEEFRTLMPNLDQLDPAYQAGAFKFLRLVAAEVAKRDRGAGFEQLKTALFEFV